MTDERFPKVIMNWGLLKKEEEEDQEEVGMKVYR
jgi:hypothetical protein